MQGRIMLARLWTFVKKQIVEDVPDEMSACIECRSIQCSEARYATCPRRLAEANVLRATQTAPPPGSRTVEQDC